MRSKGNKDMKPEITDYIQKLANLLATSAQPENAGPMKAYMKNRFEFFGIKSPERRALFREFVAEEGLPEFADLENIVARLFEKPEREFHYFAIELAGKMRKSWTRDTLSVFVKMVTLKSWWDSVDSIKSVCFRDYFLLFPEHRHEITNEWIDSGNIWLQRLSVIFQLGYREKTDAVLLRRNILLLRDSDEFFVQKAIGWALRDFARTDEGFVKKLLTEHDLKPLSRREALKHIG